MLAPCVLAYLAKKLHLILIQHVVDTIQTNVTDPHLAMSASKVDTGVLNLW